MRSYDTAYPGTLSFQHRLRNGAHSIIRVIWFIGGHIQRCCIEMQMTEAGSSELDRLSHWPPTSVPSCKTLSRCKSRLSGRTSESIVLVVTMWTLPSWLWAPTPANVGKGWMRVVELRITRVRIIRKRYVASYDVAQGKSGSREELHKAIGSNSVFIDKFPIRWGRARKIRSLLSTCHAKMQKANRFL